jgi:hypothetical protein
VRAKIIYQNPHSFDQTVTGSLHLQERYELVIAAMTRPLSQDFNVPPSKRFDSALFRCVPVTSATLANALNVPPIAAATVTHARDNLAIYIKRTGVIRKPWE